SWTKYTQSCRHCCENPASATPTTTSFGMPTTTSAMPYPQWCAYSAEVKRNDGNQTNPAGTGIYTLLAPAWLQGHARRAGADEYRDAASASFYEPGRAQPSAHRAVQAGNGGRVPAAP